MACSSSGKCLANTKNVIQPFWPCGCCGCSALPPLGHKQFGQMTKRRINCWQRCIKRRAIAPWGHKRGLWLDLRHRTGTGLWPQILCDCPTLTLILWLCCSDVLKLWDSRTVILTLISFDPVSQFGSDPLRQPASTTCSHAPSAFAPREACSSSALNLWPQWHIVNCSHRPFQQAAISFLSCWPRRESPVRRVSLKGSCTQITRRQPAVCHGCCCCCCCCVK